MNRAKTLGNFTIASRTGTCSLARDEGTIEFTPAEADRIKSLVGVALGMESLPVLPDNITDAQIVVRFLEDDSLRLERTDHPGSIMFSWREGDELIQRVEDAKQLALNDMRFKQGRPTAFSPPQSSEPFK